MKELLNQSKWSIVTALAGVIVGFVISILTARTLGVEGRGTYAFALLVMGTVGLFMNPGLYAAANFYVGSGQFSKRDAFHTALTLSLPFAILSFAVGLGVYLLLIFMREGMLEPTSIVLGFLVAVGASVMTFGGTMTGVLMGAKMVKGFALISMTSAILQAATAVVYVLLVQNYSTVFFVALFAVAQTVETVARTVLAGKGSWRSISMRVDNYRKFLHYGLIVHLGRVLLVGAQRIDAYFVFLLAGPAALGIYSISSTVAEQLFIVPTAVSMVMMANIAYRPTQDATKITSAASQTVALLSLITVGILAMAGIVLIPLIFGSDFSASILPFLIMLPGLVAVSIYPILEPFFQSRLRPWIPIRITLASVVSNALLCLLFIPRYGVIGAAAAYTLSYWVQTVLTCFAYRRFTHRRLIEPLNILHSARLIVGVIQSRVLTGTGRATAVGSD